MRSSIQAMPSPTGGNKERLFTRVSILNRAELAAYDAANGLGDLTAPASGGDTDALQSMRVAVENLLGECNLEVTQIAKIMAVLDEHAPLDRVDPDDPNAERAVAIAGDDENAEPLKAFLKEKGVSDEDIVKAMDMLPRNGIGGNLGGRLADRPSRQAQDARMRSPSQRQVARFDKKFPEAARIRSW